MIWKTKKNTPHHEMFEHQNQNYADIALELDEKKDGGKNA